MMGNPHEFGWIRIGTGSLSLCFIITMAVSKDAAGFRAGDDASAETSL
jgi:hypothetical protein